jgi:flagellar hook-basal body complex protein FliE
MASPLSAASAYSAIARLASPNGAGAPSQKSDFSALLKEALVAVNETGKKSDAQTQALAAGKSNIVDVVTAVAETEVAIDAVVAVRDRVIQAYEEIMKMPI